MLANTHISTIVPVRDVTRARNFYESTLGLRPTGDGERPDGSYAFSVAGGNELSLLPDPDGHASGRTTLSFEVDDIVGAVKTLDDSGVTFEDYDEPDLRTVDHIGTFGAEKVAWFKDTEGNILCLHSGGA
ncbi:MAG: VOC family protein [Nocardioidaceae bacterium]